MEKDPTPDPKLPKLPKRLAMSLAAVVVSGLLAALSFAPFGQFYLAWVAVVPLLWAIAGARSIWRAAAIGFAAGFVYFGLNLWYLWFIGPFPMLGSFVYLALFTVGFAVLWWPWARRTTWQAAVAAVVIWVAIDWCRASGAWALPYVALGHSQLPLLPMVQIADALGTHGVTAWVLLINVVVWATLRDRKLPMPLAVTSAGILGVVLGYGLYRNGTASFTDGPRVLLIQPDMPLLNTEPTDDWALLRELTDLTTSGLAEQPEVDLIVWPESSVRPINPESRGLPITGDYLDLIQTSHRILVRLSEFGPALLVGGSYSGDWQRVGESMRPDDRRNSVYFYREGQQQRERYDKQHLFPFGEYIPFRDQPPPIGWAYEFFQLFNPWGGDHSLTPGVQDTIFSVAGARIITPICFEDIIPYKVRQLTYADGQKRADVLVNVTNDGWFRWNQMEQHLQAAAFRSIENRLPTARSVNTGGTAIIDPDGRIRDRVSSGESGFVIGTVQLDSRHSIYGRIGDAFGFACVVMAFGGWIFLLIDRFRRRRRVEARPSDVSAPQAPDR